MKFQVPPIKISDLDKSVDITLSVGNLIKLESLLADVSVGCVSVSDCDEKHIKVWKSLIKYFNNTLLEVLK